MATIEETFLVDILHKRDFEVSATGDYQTIRGTKNVVDAIFRRIVTQPGSLIHRPQYGAGLPAYQNILNSVSNQMKMIEDIRTQLEREERINRVKDVALLKDENNPAKLTLVMRLNLVGLGDITVEEVFEF